VLAGDLVEQVASLRRDPGGDVLLNGSARLVCEIID
jgi:hypothetical protein